MTKAGWITLVGGSVTLIAARLFAVPELFLMGAIAVILPLMALAWVRRPLPILSAARTIHPRRVHLGRASQVALGITNRGTRRTPVLTLHDPVAGTVGARVALAPLRPGAREEAGYRLPTDRRGVIGIGPLSGELADPFGLARRRFEVAGATRLVVLPAIEPLPGLPMGGGRHRPRAGEAHRTGVGARADDFATLRSYVPGDDLRRVHWPSTARTGELLVRQDDVRWQGHVTLVLDGRQDHIDDDGFEAAVSAAASILHAVRAAGDRMHLIITDGTDSGPVSSRARSDQLLEELAVTKRHAGNNRLAIPTPGRARSGTLVVVTGRPTADDVAALAASRRGFAVVVLVTVNPSSVSGARCLPDDGRTPLPPGVGHVQVDADHTFVDSWSALVRRGALVTR